jgi:hypothetical protein
MAAPTSRLEVDGVRLVPEHRPEPVTIAELPREVVLVPVGEWLPGLMLYATFAGFDGVLGVKA